MTKIRTLEVSVTLKFRVSTTRDDADVIENVQSRLEPVIDFDFPTELQNSVGLRSAEVIRYNLEII